MLFCQDLVVQVLVYVLVLPRLGCPTWLSKFWFLLFFPRLGCPSFGLCFCFPKLGCPSFGLCCLSHCQIFLPQHVTVRMLNIVEVAMLPGPDSASNRMKWLAFKPEGHFGTKLPGGQCVMKLTLSTVLLCVWRGTKHVCKIKPYHRNSQSLSVSNLSFITQSQLKFHDFQRSMLIDWFRQPFILLQLHFDIDSHLHDYDLWWI